MGFCNCSMFCCATVHSKHCNHLDGEERQRDLVALLRPVFLVIFVWLFLAVPFVCLQFVIVVFPDQTHFL